MESERFDFDAWSHLAQTDSDGFEARRQQEIEALIASAPQSVQRRLRGLQWRLDHVRQRSTNPLGASVKMSQMMWQSLIGPGGLVEALERLRKPAPRRAPASVTPIRRPEG